MTTPAATRRAAILGAIGYARRRNSREKHVPERSPCTAGWGSWASAQGGQLVDELDRPRSRPPSQCHPRASAAGAVGGAPPQRGGGRCDEAVHIGPRRDGWLGQAAGPPAGVASCSRPPKRPSSSCAVRRARHKRVGPPARQDIKRRPTVERRGGPSQNPRDDNFSQPWRYHGRTGMVGSPSTHEPLRAAPPALPARARGASRHPVRPNAAST